MPELPDVQVFKEYLDATSLHQKIEDVEIRREDLLESISERSLKRRLKGQTLESTRRHAKYLFVRVDGKGWLILHFGMTGGLSYSRSREMPDYTRMLIRFANGWQLAYTCPRVLGTIGWTDDLEEFLEQKELGIDAASAELTPARFQEIMGPKRGTIKPALMDQKTISGLGNVYVDEILFQARIRPKRKVSDLSKRELMAIHEHLGRVLQAAIQARADPEQMPESFLLRCRGGEDATCPRCERPLERTKISGRTTYFCRHCQT